MVSADNANGTGVVYVIYGQNKGFPSIFNLNLINGTNGFVIHGENKNDHFGSSVATVGDINADGVVDLLVGTNKNPPQGQLSDGTAYVIFGIPDKIFYASFE